MIVLDSSAVVAALVKESDWEAHSAAIDNAREPFMSAVNVYETRIVLGRKFPREMLAIFSEVLARRRVRIVAFDADQVLQAHAAYRRYGKGSGHPARLNLGDCAAYALAKALDLPLLFKGDDFSRTDVTPAL